MTALLREPLARALREAGFPVTRRLGTFNDAFYEMMADRILAALATDPETAEAVADAIIEYGETESVSGTVAALFGEPRP